MDEFASFLRSAHFTIFISLQSSGSWSVSICHDSWWTSDLYQARVLPEWTGLALKPLIQSAKQYVEDFQNA